MCRLVWDGKLDEAREIHYKVIPTIRALFCEPNPAPIKQALNWMGVPVGGLRLPLRELTEGGKDILREALVGLGKVSPEDCK
jgi:4-hydroxy-tetrahydrodipicolinate synthase